jgi:hypothetical protein
MLIFQEKLLLDGILLEIALYDDFRYRLCYGELVEYENGKRRVRGRVRPYALRSVEQLRYDFEQDVAAQVA